MVQHNIIFVLISRPRDVVLLPFHIRMKDEPVLCVLLLDAVFIALSITEAH